MNPLTLYITIFIKNNLYKKQRKYLSFPTIYNALSETNIVFSYSEFGYSEFIFLIVDKTTVAVSSGQNQATQNELRSLICSRQKQ